ncbi:Scr1 family TA system antitoxin-like transcriptional regulator [Micromonospora sp. CPCC 206060]|uniref:Scr1 family TA system antitoxin-like transcriptional regulator n=1 Tax=Micromonospora sp. CPCC 206060 TaxID=3122406 RepID=UPI002FF3A431
MGRAEPTTVYSESITGALYLDRPAEVTTYERVWRGLEATALDAEQSRSFIESMLEEW